MDIFKTYHLKRKPSQEVLNELWDIIETSLTHESFANTSNFDMDAQGMQYLQNYHEVGVFGINLEC